MLLQNCHLGAPLRVRARALAHGFEEIQPDFRLWVTTEPHPKFPIGLLQMSIKITNEAPAGVRAGLKASYNTTITQDTLDAVSMPQWKSMLYALAFMHTIVQERRKFGPLGFNIPYEFNTSDLQASMTFMQNHLNDVEGKKRPVDWVTVNYMVCDVQYGGRITDDWDRRLNTYGQAWLAPRILEGGFEFYPGYRVAPGTDSDGYKKFVEGLPLIDDPGLFGLHSNADLVFRTAQTADVLGTVLDIQPKEGGGGGGATREELVLAQVEELMTKLPADFKGDEVKVAIRSQGGPKPLNICLQQEVDRLQKVLTVVRSSLANLKLAIAGTIVMSPDLSNALDALFMARAGGVGEGVAAAEPSLGVWFGNILQRQEQLAGGSSRGGRTASGSPASSTRRASSPPTARRCAASTRRRTGRSTTSST